MSEPQKATPIVLTVRQMARRPIHVLLQDQITFGRDCDGFLLADTRASRRHAEFKLVAGHVLLSDLGSSNGTTRNGQPIRSETRIVLGDVIGIGNSEVVVGTLARSSGLAGDDTFDHTTDIAAIDSQSSIVRLTQTVNTSDYVRDLAASTGAEGTFTIVFSDIENSTLRATALGDSSWMQVLDIHNRIIRSQLRKHGGREIKSQGDGFMMSFDSARRAVSFAIESQQEVAARKRAEPSWDLTIRLGLHTGEAVRTADGDLYGRHVIIASRIAEEAAGGEILVSALVRELTMGKVDLDFEPGRLVNLKGIGDQTVHAVRWQTPVAP